MAVKTAAPVGGRRRRVPRHEVPLAPQLLDVTMRLMRGMATKMRRSSVHVAPAQMAPLLRLSFAPSTIGELARHLGVSLPSVSKSVDILMHRGWVERSTPPEDRRQTFVHLTAAGRRIMTVMRQQAERHMAVLLAPLSAEDCEHVRLALTALTRVLPESPETCPSNAPLSAKPAAGRQATSRRPPRRAGSLP